MTDIHPKNADDLQRATGLTHETVSRNVPYYYCNDAELDALKSVGMIFNACLAFGVGGVFFGLPLLAGGTVLSVNGELQPQVSVAVGCIVMVFSAVLLLVALISHRSGDRLLKQLKGAKR